MKALIANLLNGNLSDARQQARRVSWERIFKTLTSLEWDARRARAAADYLKGKGSFQTYCDTEYRAAKGKD